MGSAQKILFDKIGNFNFHWRIVIDGQNLITPKNHRRDIRLSTAFLAELDFDADPYGIVAFLRSVIYCAQHKYLLESLT